MLTSAYLLCGAFLAIASCLQLPKYIIPCSKKDTNLDNCILEKANAAISSISSGDKILKSPSLKPLKVSSIEVDTGENLKLTITDLDAVGLEETEFISFKVDLDKHLMKIVMHLKKLNFVGTYNIVGHILVLPISGSGATNITFVDGTYYYDISWKIANRNGVDFAKIEDTKLDIKMKRATFHFDNLFGGDKILGDNMNAVLNENWEDVLKEIGGGVFHTVDTVITGIVGKIFEQVPYNELFVD